MDSRLHSEQAGRPTDATLWERLHCDKGAGRPNGGCRAVQIPLRKAQNVRWRRNTKPLPWLRRSRGGNGEFKGHVRGALPGPLAKTWHQLRSVTQTHSVVDLSIKGAIWLFGYSKHLGKVQKRCLCFLDWWDYLDWWDLLGKMREQLPRFVRYRS